jgi:hypothetical protein
LLNPWYKKDILLKDFSNGPLKGIDLTNTIFTITRKFIQKNRFDIEIVPYNCFMSGGRQTFKNLTEFNTWKKTTDFRWRH